MAVIEKFIRLDKVKKGDLLLTYDGKEEVVESIEFMPSTEDVYNLEVEGNHNYYAEGILVHNKWGGWGEPVYFGSYKGNDAESRAKIAFDKSTWVAALDQINLLNEKANRLVDSYESQREFASDVYGKQRELQTKDYITQQDTARAQVGQTGLVSGTATQQLAGGKEAFSGTMEIGKTEFESRQDAEALGLQETLFDIANTQTNLYEGYVKNMQTGDDPPDYSSGYSGGNQWVEPTKGGPIEGFMGLECFSGDTKVDDKEISKIKVGDMVASYNEKTKIIEKAEVIDTFIHKHDKGYLVVNGRIKATPNHPFYVRRNV